MRKNNVASTIKDYLIITLGVILVAFGIQYFYAPNEIAGGGLSGLALVISHYIPFLSVGTIIFLGNIILFIVAFILVGGDFGMKTIYASFALSFIMDLMEKVGGTDILAKILNKYSSINIGISLLIVDLFVVICGALTFGLDKGIYSLLAVVMNGLVVDRVTIYITKKQEEKRALKETISKENIA